MSNPTTPILDKNKTRIEGEEVSNLCDFDVEQHVDEDTGDVVETRKPWTIISALNRVLALARGFSQFLGCTRITIMEYSDEIEDLVKKRWAYRCGTHEMGCMREGFACLFFGAPGTGKTDTVLQIARQTGRDIMQVDIAGMRDKYVGESEKNIKAVFAHYRRLCKESEVMPILFFNEADGIFGKRTTVGGKNPSVEKMDNAMQNIILQEVEDLDGILIATTNLTCNLDSAFERRFLFKVEFQKPSTEVKAKLWSSMLGEGITEAEAFRLASRYDFSGGQIENIARKRTIEYILSGKKAGFDEIDEFCQQELLNKRSAMKPIGFKCA